MSIQPLNNTVLPAYTPPGGAKQATDTAAGQAHASEAAAASNEAQQAQSSKQPDKKAILNAVEEANLAVDGPSAGIRFALDQDSGVEVVRIIDRKTQEVIRQIPAQDMLELRKHMDELRGLLIKDKA